MRDVWGLGLWLDYDEENEDGIDFGNMARVYLK